MASVINAIIGRNSYRQCASTILNSSDSPDGVIRWDLLAPYSTNIQKFSSELQLKGYLEQLIALSYYVSFYEKGCNLLIDEYLEETITYFEFTCLPRFKQATKDTNSFDAVIEAATLLVKHIKTGMLQEPLNVEAIEMFLDLYKDSWLPTVENEETWIKPYLIWLSWYWTGGTKDHQSSCTCIEKYSIPSFEFIPLGENSDRYILGLKYYPMSSTFCATNCCKSEGLRKVRIYDYLARFNLAGCSVETIFGVIGDTCLSLDVYRPGASASQKVAATIRARVLGIVTFSGDTDRIQKPLSSCSDYYRGACGLFDATKWFIEYVTKTYGATLDDKSVVTKIFNGFAETKEQKDSVNYLRNQGVSASADDLAAYNKELGSLEALQFISQNNALLVAQSQATDPKAAAEGEDTENKESESKEDDSKSEETKSEGKDDSTSGDDSPEGDDSDAGEDDTSEEEEEDAGDENPDEGSGDGGESSDTSSSSDVSDMPSEDEQPNTSDPKGFKFKVANPEAETTDSVMFREEMDHFLSNILANPPEDLSPQNIQTLTSLHRYWLHTLSIGTIMGIVGSCMKHLPESLKQLSTQCTE